MAISRLRALGLALLLASGAAAEGCARSAAEPPRTSPVGTSAPAPARAPSMTPPAAAPHAPDPSEEITPEELGTIPEPVPPQSAGSATPDLRSAPRAPQGAPEGALWRVQVFATEDRALADRTAAEAALHLGAKAHVTREGSHYKVRLGDYGSEREAADLRDLAARSGYPGAFRIRCEPDTTLNKN